MSLILLADREPSSIDQLRSTLTAQGWQVRAVQSREQALQAASEQAPNLVLVDGRLAGARDLIRRFCRRSGGPGVILLANESQEAAALSMPEAEWVLTKPLPSEKLIQTVREGLSQTKADGAPPGPPAQGGRIYTSQDIFGDLLADLGDRKEEPAAEAAAVGKGIQPSTEPVPASEQASTPPPAPTPPEGPRRPAVEPAGQPAAPAQRLGLHFDDTRPGTRAVAQAVGAAGAARPAGAASQASSVDSLLEKTLSGLRLPNLRPRSQASTSRPPLPWPAGVAGDRRPSGAQAAVPVPKSDPSSAEVEVKAMLEKKLTGIFLEDLERRAARSNTAPPAAEYAPPVTAPAAEPVAEEVLSVPPGVVELPPLPPTAGQASPVYPVEDGLPSLTQVEEEATTEPPADGQEFVRELGDYGLEEKIGVGAMADVWKARRKGVEGFEKTVALKTILPHFSDNPDFVERFIDEAKLAAQLNHNNITEIYDLGKAEGEFFIAMEFVDGKDLRTILDTGRRRGKPLPVGFALLIASRISMALDYAHRKRGADNRPLHLVHRDVSPRNILISFEGEIKLCDFGIAKAVTKASTTQIGELKGKLMYMSPEQARGKPADSRSDIFSAGAVLYEMLAGEPLFSGDTEIRILEAARRCQVETRLARSQIPTPAQEVLRQALARNSSVRFQTAGELQLEIDRLHHSITDGPGQRELAAYLTDLFQRDEEDASLEPEPLTVRQATPLPEAPTATTPLDEKTVPVAPVAATPDAEDEPPRSRRRHILAVVGAGAVLALLLLSAWFVLTRGTTEPLEETPRTSAAQSAAPDDLQTPQPVVASATPLSEPAAAGISRRSPAFESEQQPGPPTGSPASSPPSSKGADREGRRNATKPLPLEGSPAPTASQPPAPPELILGGEEVLPREALRQLEEELRRVEELLTTLPLESASESEAVGVDPRSAPSSARAPRRASAAQSRSADQPAPEPTGASHISQVDEPTSEPTEEQAGVTASGRAARRANY